MDVFVTGSNDKFLSKDIVTEFAGRGDEVHMYPLSFAEFMSVYKGDKYILIEANEELNEYDESMVRKYIQEIKIYDDRFKVCFKAGIELDIPI